MFTQKRFLPSGRNKMSEYEEEDHEDFSDRLCKTFYYGKLPSTDRPSLPLTDIAVEFFQGAAPRKLGKLDTYLAASSSRSACISPCSVMVGMLYVKRLRKSNPLYLQQVSSSDLFLISMMMASKFMYDEGIDDEVFNDEWAESADLDLADVNQMERDFLSAIDWKLFVYQEEFLEMLKSMEQKIALRQGRDRGWFTYTDLYLLATSRNLLPLQLLATDMSKVLAVTSLAYLAGILTMVASTILVTTASTALVTMAPGMLPLVTRTGPLCPILPTISEDHSVSLTHGNLTFAPLCDSGIHQLTTTVETEVEDGRKQTESETLPKRESWSNMLSPLLALFTLKDSFVNFVMAAMNEKSHFVGNRSAEGKRPSFFCSQGPCQLESWSNCWNVTGGENVYKDSETGADCQSTKSLCCGKCGQRGDKTRQLDWSKDRAEAESDSVNAQTVQCCCGTGARDPASLLDQRDVSFMNEPFRNSYVNLGFSTASWHPTLVTA